MKIVYVTPQLYTADGVARVLTMKANYFAEHFGYEITIIITEGKGKPNFYPLSDKVRVINLELNFEELWHRPFISKALIYLRKQRQYKRLLTNELMKLRPDITVTLLRREINFINQIKDGSRKIGEMHVLRSHFRNFEKNDTNFLKELFAQYWMYRLIGQLRQLDRMIVLTEKDRKTWTELDNVMAISNPLPMMPKSVSSLTEKRVIAVGRYYQEKGFDLLLEAWSKVYKNHPDWRLEIFGDGDKEYYEAIRDKLGVPASCCILNGRTNQIELEYLKSSIYVCSSRFEGFGMVIVEAMACGLAVVSFDCPWGPSSIIADGEDGILVENGNIDKMAEALAALMDNPEKQRMLSNHAVRNVQRFQMDNIAEQWKVLFESLL
ncbi:MAG: glycosyltransferase family 4 protein [Prevotella sp.]|nr:glycosyltransferase family 4 protein [Prevotella sp.]